MYIDSQTLFSALFNEIHHLALLRNSGLVSDRRAGQWIYYQVNPEMADWVIQILQIIAVANRDTEPFIRDLDLLKGMPSRPGAACCA